MPQDQTGEDTLTMKKCADKPCYNSAKSDLQFDESKSQNPFAYYTAAITNSFTRILNIEKKNQNIRDDILEMNGLNPSWTRQNSGKAGMAAMSGPVVTTYEE
jgi:hypothetical protein